LKKSSYPDIFCISASFPFFYPSNPQAAIKKENGGAMIQGGGLTVALTDLGEP
jgi:hypothetical protein